MTAEEIKALKAKHGEGLTLVTIQAEGKTHEFVLKKPTRNVIEAVTSVTGIAEQNTLLINSCVVHGDQAVLDSDGDIYLKLLEELGKIQGQATSEVKKL